MYLDNENNKWLYVLNMEFKYFHFYNSITLYLIGIKLYSLPAMVFHTICNIVYCT